MGICLSASDVARNSSLSSDPSKVTSKTSLSSAPSTLTCSTPSTLTVASCSETSAYRSAPTRTEGEILSSSNAKAFTFSELRSASRNFRSDCLIGEGGFGYVYKGWLNEFSLTAAKPGAGIAVAIKKLKSEGFQGHKEWLTEVDYLGQLQHPNLVKLFGYCAEGDNRLLVYEYMPKGSLEDHIFRRSIQPLSWGLRMKVAVDAARGLAFLHDAESQVIYRDVKASNILLDMDCNAKLSDFGLAKAGPTGDRTHVSTQVMGTQGYAAPEYVATGRLTAKADVYSFGVVLLELLSGRRAFDKSKVGIEQNLVDWARPLLSDKHKISRIMDTRLEGQYPKKGASAVAGLALQCLGNNAKRRPQMSQVVAALEKQQDLREAVNLRRADEQNASMPIPRSPMMYQRSTNRAAPGGSPLQPSRRAMRVH